MTTPPEWVGRIRMADYDYPLPPHRIASHPLPNRADAKLLVAREGALSDTHFHELPSLLPAGTLICLNDTHVVPARLLFRRETGACIEVLCLEPLAPAPEVALAMAATHRAEWLCLVGNAKKWQPGETLAIETPQGLHLRATKHAAMGAGHRVGFEWDPAHESFAAVLEALGRVPLPPYLRREAEPADHARYQTVYAAQPGAVAAPTAGLHFTPELLAACVAAGAQTCHLTLHVGAGTFRPVAADSPAGHGMHAEQVVARTEAIAKIAQHRGPVLAVGTTSLRTLESLFWHGLAVHEGRARPASLNVGQWEPYAEAGMRPNLPPPPLVLARLADALAAGGHSHLVGATQIILLPGYAWQVANLLQTNFHQPQSTLLLLVGGFVGQGWKRLYGHALAHQYRFLSYGDTSLLWRNSLPL